MREGDLPAADQPLGELRLVSLRWAQDDVCVAEFGNGLVVDCKVRRDGAEFSVASFTPSLLNVPELSADGHRRIVAAVVAFCAAAAE
ncbi:hypothetical protein [Lentzea sp. NPDC004782]|uniref:hypothetical protein n=1 Tax=Lentzea sp. NPDC004782 TaxID=3154458 RepID=UPI0033BF5D05